MPYIDQTYYLDDYMGKPITDTKELDRAILRASETVDLLTNYKIGDIALQTSFISTQIKKATAALVEYYVISGGYDQTVSSGSTDFSIGNFSYKEGSVSKQVPNNVIEILSFTGLMYAGLDVNYEC